MTIGICKTISDYPSVNGAMPLLFSVRDCVPLAFPGLLFALFIVIFGVQYFVIQAKTGRVKILIGLLSTSIFTTVLSMVMALGQLVTFWYVLFYAFVAIISFILLEISDEA